MIKLNEKVVSKRGYCIGYIITEFWMYGEIVKVNKSSFRVRFERTDKREKGNVVETIKASAEVTYKFWKEVNGKKLFVPTISGGKKIYGIIEL